jgi:hypothetical protein
MCGCGAHYSVPFEVVRQASGTTLKVAGVSGEVTVGVDTPDRPPLPPRLNTDDIESESAAGQYQLCQEDRPVED